MTTNSVGEAFCNLVRTASGTRERILNAPCDERIELSKENQDNPKLGYVCITVADPAYPEVGRVEKVHICISGSSSTDPGAKYFTGRTDEGKNVCGRFKGVDPDIEGELITQID